MEDSFLFPGKCQLNYSCIRTVHVHAVLNCKLIFVYTVSTIAIMNMQFKQVMKELQRNPIQILLLNVSRNLLL